MICIVCVGPIVSFVSSVSCRRSPDHCRRSPRTQPALQVVTPTIVPTAACVRSHCRTHEADLARESDMPILLDPQSYLLVSAGIFAGAVVSGLMGFAFSAVAGAILLHVLPPTEAVPLMMAC